MHSEPAPATAVPRAATDPVAGAAPLPLPRAMSASSMSASSMSAGPASPSSMSAAAGPSGTRSAGTDPQADADALRRHVQGDPDAFAELFRAHADRLWSVAFGVLGDVDEAADAVQEAMLSAHRRAASFRGDATVATWLHRIVTNAAIDRLRRRAARPTIPLPASPEGSTFEPADSRDAIAERDTRLDIGAALDRLSPQLRAAVVLVDVEGLPVAEAARLLDVPVGTVKSRCSRARAQLAVLLGHLRPGNPAASPSVLDGGRWGGNAAASSPGHTVVVPDAAVASDDPGTPRASDPHQRPGRPPLPGNQRTGRDCGGRSPSTPEEVIGGGD